MFQLNRNMYFITVYAFSEIIKHPTSEENSVQNSIVPMKFTSVRGLYLKVKVHVSY